MSIARCAAVLVVAPALATAVFAQDTQPSDFHRPKYQVLRFNEDWSGLAGRDRSTTGDVFDPIKYVPLSDDGEVWASFGGQFRLRIEGWNNFNWGAPATADPDDTYPLIRGFLHADIHVGQNLRFFIEGKTAWAVDRDLSGGPRTLDVDSLDLQNAFVDLSLPLEGKDKFTFRAGRQELLLGRQRLVSPLDWSNTRRTFDGFSGILKTGDWTTHAFWTRFVPVDKYDFNDQDANTDFFGVYATGKVPGTPVGIDLYWLGLDSESGAFTGTPFGAYNTTAGDEERHTLGGRLFQKLDCGFDYDLEGAYQFGEVDSEDVDAFMAAAQFGYTFADCPTSPRVFAGVEYASGDESAGGEVNTFSQLFPLGHAYFGWIDQIGRQNIIDLWTGVTLRPMEKLTVDLHGHVFWRADDSDALYNAGGTRIRPTGAAAVPEGLSRCIGSEIDLLVVYNLDRHTDLSVGYSHFFAGTFVEQTGPSDDIDFVYLTLQFTF